MNHLPQWYPEGQVLASEAAVTVEDLTVAAPDGRLLLDGGSLEVRPGLITALTGPSGCGKTTLLRAVAGVLPPAARRTAGRVEVLGQDVLALGAPDLRALRRRLAYLGQDPGSGLNPRMKVRRLLGEVAVDRSPEALRALLAEVQLPTDDGFMGRRTGELSGGQQRRVALARALARHPAVLLLDEPTAGLDPALRDEIAELLRHLAASHRLAVALSCHDADLVARLADDVVDLSRGVATPPAPARTVGRPLPQGRETLSVSGLHAAFVQRGRRIPVVHDIDLAVAAGSSTGIVGASGSGKTTLVRAVVGLHRPTGGTVTLDGVRLAPAAHGRTRDQRRRLQLVPQDPLGTLNPSRTVGATIGRPLQLHRRAGREQSPARVLELLEHVGLPANFAHRYPHELSGGQRQRASIARALAADPDVLVCDEVTSALDDRTAGAIMDLLEELRDSRGLALVLISHDLRLIASRTDSLLVLSAGCAVESGPTPRIFTSPSHPVTASLVAGAIHPA
ncbi:ATP-binding cassette domain-containing protein [Streptomyces sp. NBC_01142]|uniref:ABC transporter ATP-binding protein n=1 Tax=Streptomyces sp. NBC_01142 TaxID=2975865 RepID=UPI00224F7B09|nr:ATP-binding cassette domain-containing protein [Streptomyces sp. NBC_01142]MCX4819921.1 ATP-binding cassette domain-containing protein [Streptomyces sp. NBC_01142]